MSMTVYFSDKHRLHFPKGELHGGQLVEPFERPSRMDTIVSRLHQCGFDDIRIPDSIDLEPVHSVHAADYLQFLRTAWRKWEREGFIGDLIPTIMPARRMPGMRCPENIDGQAGWYAMAIETSITSGTWEAALSSCAVAQSAQRHVAAGGVNAAFALCRPPGHHAMKDMYGGYCFINNAAVAAQMFIDSGVGKAAILDVDFHHCNGTQDIFYDRADVLVASLHGDPVHAFPYFSGYADETGSGPGAGCNINVPMAPGTGYVEWKAALDSAIGQIGSFGAEALVVSLGVDTYKSDPISFFKLESEDFVDCGRLVATVGLPTVIVMEGGYAINEIGLNAVGFLEGFVAT